jgi:GNAT superfamily N-acetyltransferase
MITLSRSEAAAPAPWFAPERPGPLIHAHVVATGHGRVRVDRLPDPRLVLAEVPGNLALRGDPDRLGPLPDLAGFVEAPPGFLPALRALDPGVALWDRVVAVLPDTAPVDLPRPSLPVRRLRAADAAALATLDPSIDWIAKTWGGPAGLAASGRAWAAFDGPRPVSVAVPFLVGERHEDIGVVTDPGHRGRGLSTACVAALVTDIRARGRRPSWTTSPDNVASRAVAARLGFVHVRDDVLYAVRTPIPT